MDEARRGGEKDRGEKKCMKLVLDQCVMACGAGRSVMEACYV